MTAGPALHFPNPPAACQDERQAPHRRHEWPDEGASAFAWRTAIHEGSPWRGSKAAVQRGLGHCRYLSLDRQLGTGSGTLLSCRADCLPCGLGILNIWCIGWEALRLLRKQSAIAVGSFPTAPILNDST